jgi:hypothetical protein
MTFMTLNFKRMIVPVSGQWFRFGPPGGQLTAISNSYDLESREVDNMESGPIEGIDREKALSDEVFYSFITHYS